jgi:hypothetical protein
MKKGIIFFAFCAIMTLTSCYNATIVTNGMGLYDECKVVDVQHNSHFIEGLVNSPRTKASQYVDETKPYKVHHYLSFTDMLIGAFTLGIYTPSTTKWYVPEGTTK